MPIPSQSLFDIWNMMAGPESRRRAKETELQDLIISGQKQQQDQQRQTAQQQQQLFEQGQENRQRVTDFIGAPTAQIATPEQIGQAGERGGVPWSETLQAQEQARQPVQREGNDLSRMLAGLTQASPEAGLQGWLQELQNQAQQTRGLEGQRETNRLNIENQQGVLNEQNKKSLERARAAVDVLMSQNPSWAKNIDPDKLAQAFTGGFGNALIPEKPQVNKDIETMEHLQRRMNNERDLNSLLSEFGPIMNAPENQATVRWLRNNIGKPEFEVGLERARSDARKYLNKLKPPPSEQSPWRRPTYEDLGEILPIAGKFWKDVVGGSGQDVVSFLKKFMEKPSEGFSEIDKLRMKRYEEEFAKKHKKTP